MTKTGSVRPLKVQVLDDTGAILQELFFAQEKIVIGRILSADLKVEDPSVSRVHALLEVMDNKISVTDLASTHGTYIADKKVLNSEIKPGQEFRVGRVRIHIKDGALDKVPAEFRQNYLETAATPPFGTSVVEPTTPAVVVPPPKTARPIPEAPKQKSHVPASVPHAPKAPAHVEKAPPKKVRKSGDSFTQEIVREHSHVLGQGQCLSVTMYWNEAVLDDSLFRGGSVVRIGEAPRNDYMIPMGGIEPADRYVFAEVDEGGATLRLHREMSGRLRMQDKIHNLDQMDQIPGAKKEGQHYVVRLGRRDFAKISVGTLTFFLIFVPEPPPVPVLPFWEKDSEYRRLALLVLLFFFILAAPLFLFVDATNITDIKDVPERFRPIIVDPTKTPKIFARQARVVRQGGNEGEGARSAGADGKRGEKQAKNKEGITNIPKTPDKQKSSAAGQKARERKQITDQQVAQNAGILGALKGAGLGGALGKIGGSDPLKGLMLGLSGAGASEKSGYGSGTGLKGTGGGGGGTAGVGIGGLGTKGTGFGRTGIGSGSIPGKGEADVSTIADNVQVMGGLDKALIEAVVRRHLSEIRYCYESELQRFPKLAGKVVAGWTIDGSGRVSDSRIVSSSLSNQSVESCIRTAIRRWIFPSPEGGTTVVVSGYPFILNRR